MGRHPEEGSRDAETDDVNSGAELRTAKLCLGVHQFGGYVPTSRPCPCDELAADSTNGGPDSVRTKQSALISHDGAVAVGRGAWGGIDVSSTPARCTGLPAPSTRMSDTTALGKFLLRDGTVTWGRPDFASFWVGIRSTLERGGE